MAPGHIVLSIHQLNRVFDENRNEKGTVCKSRAVAQL